MKYISTRGRIKPVQFQDAVMMGLADDGGLIIPASIPDLSGDLERFADLPYDELAYEIIRHFVDDIPERDLEEMIEKTYLLSYSSNNQVAPVFEVGPVFIQELWHGPTLAFKDIALQFLGNLFQYILEHRGGRLTILGATSGDTGSAAICGVRGRAGIEIFVMHPGGRVSPIQERQMTTVLDSNVHNIAIDGSFDDCQRIMKTLAGDLEFKRQYSIGAVNSVNWARVLAQIVYYFYGSLDVRGQAGSDAVSVSVPTGNFGDILAGWYAKKMGAPISKLILATNENDILARFFNTGEYSLGEVFTTSSPSMDIQVASNFERYLYYRLGSDPFLVREKMESFAEYGKMTVDGAADSNFLAGSADQHQVLDAIHRYHDEHGYILDPHTAVGVCVAETLGSDLAPVMCMATAHPAKFPAVIEQAVGQKGIAVHPSIEAMMKMETRCTSLPNDIEAVRKFIIDTVA